MCGCVWVWCGCVWVSGQVGLWVVVWVSVSMGKRFRERLCYYCKLYGKEAIHLFLVFTISKSVIITLRKSW